MKTVIEMAREAGFTQPEGETWYEAFPQCIERFAELARAEERNECAKVVESHGPFLANGAMLAAAIRVRGDKHD